MTNIKTNELILYCLLFFIIVICVILFIGKGLFTDAKITKVVINDKVIDVELAITPEQQFTGLSGREFLGPNKGMLFVFEKKKKVGFWMKDMKFPLDLILIRDNKVVELIEKIPVPTSDNIPTYNPKELVSYVLEVNAGFCQKNQIKIGDKVKLK